MVNFYIPESGHTQNRHHGNSRDPLRQLIKSNRRNNYGDKARRVNQKSNRRGKENFANSKNQNKTEAKIPRHPSLDGFELHKNRNGKSTSSDKVSMATSTSEVISVKENKIHDSSKIEAMENVIKNERDGQNMKQNWIKIA